HDGRFLAWAAYSPASMIRLRAWSFIETERIDAAFFARRIARALAVRETLQVDSDSVRLIHGEADGLPGLIVDRYGDTLCAQITSAAAERWRGVIATELLKASGATRLYERSDASVRNLEGLAPRTGWISGDGTGDEKTEITIREHGWRLNVDVATGHKTGFYLDQRDNRRIFADTVRQFGYRRVLNCFSYTGGFSVAALAGGATDVTSVDSSGPALAHAEAHVLLNGFDPAHHHTLDADVNRSLREMIDRGERFDAIVLDPPKFAPTAAHAERAARAYKDINRLAFLLLRPGGALFTFSCSGGIGGDLFHKIVAGAGLDAGIDARIHARLAAAPDHPMTVTFPEGEYLKGLVLVAQ
ncbi:MAG: class I SAM-dependent methyltransferase, partial [Burkholderiales bacterium]